MVIGKDEKISGGSLAHDASDFDLTIVGFPLNHSNVSSINGLQNGISRHRRLRYDMELGTVVRPKYDRIDD